MSHMIATKIPQNIFKVFFYVLWELEFIMLKSVALISTFLPRFIMQHSSFFSFSPIFIWKWHHQFPHKKCSFWKSIWILENFDEMIVIKVWTYEGFAIITLCSLIFLKKKFFHFCWEMAFLCKNVDFGEGVWILGELWWNGRVKYGFRCGCLNTGVLKSLHRQ